MITYGTILEINYLDELSTVMLINNTTDGTLCSCKVLDLDSKEIILDFESIEDFKQKTSIVKVVGQFEELFNI